MGCRGSFGRRPESFFGKPNGPAPSAKITEASASDAPLRGLTKRPLRLAGLEKVATLEGLDKNGLA